MTVGGGYQDWEQLRNHAIAEFGDTPRAETEARIIAAYELHPDQVERTIHAVAADVHAGTVRSGWAVLNARIGNITAPPANPQRNTGVTREKALARADQWMRNAGCYHDEAEAILHLCDGGLLASYAQAELVNDGPGTPARLQVSGDPAVIAHIRTQHTLERPRGLAADTAAEARAEAWKTQHQKEKASRSQPSSSDSSPSPSAPSPSDSQSESSPTSHANRKEPPRTPNLENTPL
jgi:hypothetical protein